MAFFDDLSKKVTKLGQDVSNKTQNFTDGMKINNQINEQRNNLSRLFEQLGHAAVQLEAVRTDAGCAQLVEQIRATENHLKELEKQKAMNKGNVQCKQCGAFVEAGNAFCSSCGAKMEQPQPAQANAQSGQTQQQFDWQPANQEQPVSGTCSKCGQPVAEGMAFCTNCGTPVQK